MKLIHIDNSHFKLSAAQAKQLGGGQLPRPGFERFVDSKALENVQLFSKRDGKLIAWACPAKLADSKSVMRTPLKWWNGKDVKSGWVWCLSLYFSPSF